MSDVRLIDANALIEEIRELLYTEARPSAILSNFTQMCFNTAIELVQIKALEAPTIDAVPVVRCKDCKHRQNPKECYMCFTEVEDIEGGRMYKFTDLTCPDGFCHKGEKMDGGGER